ncbi:MAG: hypothetical protein L0Y35_05265 [Flammeovirgaceae bacterium]|nr:hypothetical protein [Flammeovirgaceae bacterium]
MRKELAKQEGARKKFRATFSRFGKKTSYTGYPEETILLKKITDIQTNLIMADHIWFTLTKGFEKISLTEGTVLEFEARVKEYSKGYVNKRYGIARSSTDFKLSHPTKIREVK